MGHHFAGFVINKNYNGKLKEFEKEFNYKIENYELSDYNDAFLGNTPEGYIDLYFGDKGTIIFSYYNEVIDKEGVYIPNHRGLSFVTNEVSMAYYFHLTENENIVRSFYNQDHEIVSQEGQRLPNEADDDPYGTIISVIDDLLGEHVGGDIIEYEKVFRVKID